MADSELDLRLLRVLVELAQRGTMREVAEVTGYSPSAVSAQLAELGRQSGAPLIERTGRTVRLTPAGLRLVDHARGILEAVDAARADLAQSGAPSGLVRVASFASALERDCVPVTLQLLASHPAVEVLLAEHEPADSLALLRDGDVDLAVVYDYALAPRPHDPAFETTEVSHRPMVLAMPSELAGSVRHPRDLPLLADQGWIVNSRGPDDDELAARLCAQAGFTPRVSHRVDSLDLMQTLIAARLGVALMPDFVHPWRGVATLALPGTGALRRMWLVTRRGHSGWPAVRLMMDSLLARSQQHG